MTIRAGSWNSKDDDSNMDKYGFSGGTPENPKANKPAEKLSSKRPSSYTSQDDPPQVNYNKLYTELGSYNFTIDKESNITDIRHYLETIQKYRSRLIAMEQEAERHYSSVDSTYEILFAYELINRPEKTAKEKEAGALLALKKWFEVVEEAKIYAGAVKKYREQLDATHHLLTKILSTYDLEIRMRGYQGGGKPQGGDPIMSDWGS